LVAAAIEEFTEAGDLILDPFMGGGTTAVEALVRDRSVVGSDINSLSVFVARVKTTPLSARAAGAVRGWQRRVREQMSYRSPRELLAPVMETPCVQNLELPRARPIKKAIAFALAGARCLKNPSARSFAKCCLLKTAQWALDGRRSPVTFQEFRTRLDEYTQEMLQEIDAFGDLARQHGDIRKRRTLLNADATCLDTVLSDRGLCGKVKLIVTSPPYPGVHVLYHRWQVDGRRETPAPYWIAGCRDGRNPAYYTFGDRRERSLDTYFDNLLYSLLTLREVVRDDGILVQLIAFRDPEAQLPRYLHVMSEAGFREVSVGGTSGSRVWRDVPNRRWHATLNGLTPISRELVLVHRAA
jgi:hypothetical protein